MKKALMVFSLATMMALSTACSKTEYEITTEKNETKQEQVNKDMPEQKEETEEERLERIKSKGVYPQLEEIKAGETVATISTNMGDIKVRFFPEYAPIAVENFVTHAKEGYYDGVIFHRVIEDFMIQGGDPQGTGMGGESIWGQDFGVEETADLKHIRGALCMAKTSEPISIGSQFYIVQNNKLDENTKSQIEAYINNQETDSNEGYKVKDFFPKELMEEYLKQGGTPHLDFQYTVFGQVYEGMDVVDKIAEVEKDENDKPKTDVIINNITVSEY